MTGEPTDSNPLIEDQMESLEDVKLPGQVTASVVPRTATFTHMQDFARLGQKLRYQRLQALAELTSGNNEHWEAPNGSTDEALPVLSRYINYTFRRVREQEKIAYTPDMEWAVFHTGLLTKFFDQIFGVFRKSRIENDAPWFLVNFVPESDRLLSRFAALPPRATYFEKPADLVYDTDRRLVWDEHTLMDRSVRFPESLQGESDDAIHRRKQAINEAVKQAIFRVEQSYRTAIPQFYWGDTGPGKLQLLLPLCLEIATRTDLAFAVYRDHEVYRAATPLRLDWAYSNARLIAKPDSEWLQPS